MTRIGRIFTDFLFYTKFVICKNKILHKITKSVKIRPIRVIRVPIIPNLTISKKFTNQYKYVR